MRDLTIIIPAHNEEKGLPQVVADLRRELPAERYDYEIVVVDDGSQDGTAAAAAAAGARLVRNERRRGYGAALKRGLRESESAWVAITDADGTYPAAALPPMLAARAEADMIVGARLGPEARIPLVRRPAKFLLNAFARFLSGQPIPDLNSGLRVFKRVDARRFLPLLPDGFSFTTTLTLALLGDAREVRYQPIAYHRRTGHSKIRPLGDTINFFALVLRLALLFNPLKVFLPAGLLLLIGGCAAAVVQALRYGEIGSSIDVVILGGIQVLMFGLLADMIRRRTHL